MTTATPETENRTPELDQHTLRQAYLYLERWIATQGERGRTAYRARLGDSRKTMSMHQAGKLLNVSRQRTSQIIIGQINQIEKLIKDDLQAQPVAQLAQALAENAGTAVPQHEMDEMLAPPHGVASHAGAIIALAGHYKITAGWYIRRDRIRANPTGKIRRELESKRFMLTSQARKMLGEWELKERQISPWLAANKLDLSQSNYLLPASARATDYAYIILREMGKPATGQQITKYTPMTDRRQHLNARMSQDNRFQRRTRTKYALTEWEEPEYTTMPDQMAREIERRGGSMTINELIAYMRKEFEASESSIRYMARAPRFVHRKGGVSLLHDPEKYRHSRANLRTARGVFHLGPGRVGLIFPIHKDTLRGSGISISRCVTDLLKLPIDQKITLDAGQGRQVRIVHRMNNSNPTLSTIKDVLRKLNARAGDSVTTIIDINHRTARVNVVRNQEISTGWESVARLTGIDPKLERQGLADALMCKTSQLQQMLRGRKDEVILQAMPAMGSRKNGQTAVAEKTTTQHHRK